VEERTPNVFGTDSNLFPAGSQNRNEGSKLNRNGLAYEFPGEKGRAQHMYLLKPKKEPCITAKLYPIITIY
jgi:hypothetical protein